MSLYLGDFDPGKVVRVPWGTNGADGASITRATNGTVQVYKDGDASSESTTGITDTEDFDGLTGVHMASIDTSQDSSFYSLGHEYTVVCKTMTIDGKSVNAVLAHFSIGNRSALRPATAGRTIVVDANGLADATAVKVGPSGAATAQTAGDIPARLPAALTGGGNIKADAQVVSDKTGYALSAAGILAIWDQAVAGLVAAGSIGKRIVDFLTGDSFTRLGAPAGASIAADVAQVAAKTNLIPAAPAAVGDIPTANQNADALLDRADAIETGWTVRKTLRVMSAVLAGIVSGAATVTNVFKSLTGHKTRVTSTVDASGNRSAVVLDGDA